MVGFDVGLEAYMKTKKNKIILTCVYGFLLLINIIPLTVYRDRAALTLYSIPGAAVMCINIFHGIAAYCLRYRDNYLIFGKRRSILYIDSDREASDEDLKMFYQMFKIYCAPIPFYLPVIFFSQSLAQSCWAFAVYFAPQILYFGMGFKLMRDEMKEEKQKREQLEKERLEQEKREELGYWK